MHKNEDGWWLGDPALAVPVGYYLNATNALIYTKVS
jgi:hypothetical protein